MTNHNPRHPDMPTINDSNAGPQRPIPDGGLGSAMPDWLQETPSWKRPAEQAPVRSIPDPDTSVIDPRQLIDVDDLPHWLQAVSLRNTGERSETVASTDTGSLVNVAEKPVIPLEPPVPDQEGSPDPVSEGTDAQSGSGSAALVRLMPSPSAASKPWWMSDVAVGILFVGILLTMMYVILVASGVV